MRSLVFEGNTWAAYEKLRLNDKKLHRTLCRMLKEMLRDARKPFVRDKRTLHPYIRPSGEIISIGIICRFQPNVSAPWL